MHMGGRSHGERRERYRCVMGFHDLVERQINKGRREGLFDDLPGHGKPIADLDRHRKEGWWAINFAKTERARMREEDLTHRKRTIRYKLRRANVESEVVAIVESFNAAIAEHNRMSRDLTQIKPFAELSLPDELARFKNRTT